MVNCELSHNPYLLETKVLFNNQASKINSQIEKYEHIPLKEWADKIPGIFYDEMNGYDFDLNFSATSSDFDEVKKSFLKAKVGPLDVRLIYKNELEDADTKSKEIDSLLIWLKENPNRKFDFDAFMVENGDLFEKSYPLVIVCGQTPVGLNPDISPEIIEDVSELNETVLTDTPILFSIDENSQKAFRKNLLSVLSRADVGREQLFFMFHPAVNVSRTVRVISDLGVLSPQIIRKYDDPMLLSYFRDFPVTRYIHDAIVVFSSCADKIDEVLKKENEESEITNADVHSSLDMLDGEIHLLEEANEHFLNRDNFILPKEFEDIRDTLKLKINNFRKRRTKVTGDSEIDAAASEYENTIYKSIDEYNSEIETAWEKTKDKISGDFHVIYAAAGTELSFEPQDVITGKNILAEHPNIKESLIELKEVTYSDQRSDFLSIFLNYNEENKEPVRVVTARYDEWRIKAYDLVMPLIDKVEESCKKVLTDYYNALALAYMKHIDELIDERKEEKNQISAKLSDSEKQLEADNDWFSEFKNRLAHIERG